MGLCFYWGFFLSFFFLSFATGCVVTGEDVKCSCKPGYTGARCERWVPPSPAPPSLRPHLTGGVGSAGRLLQAPRVWVGLCWVVAQSWGGAAGFPEAGKRSLGKNTRLSLHRSLTSFSSLLVLVEIWELGPICHRPIHSSKCPCMPMYLHICLHTSTPTHTPTCSSPNIYLHTLPPLKLKLLSPNIHIPACLYTNMQLYILPYMHTYPQP